MASENDQEFNDEMMLELALQMSLQQVKGSLFIYFGQIFG
jgi:hypothetical protein